MFLLKYTSKCLPTSFDLEDAQTEWNKNLYFIFTLYL